MQLGLSINVASVPAVTAPNPSLVPCMWWLGPVSFMWVGSPSYTFPKFIG